MIQNFCRVHLTLQKKDPCNLPTYISQHDLFSKKNISRLPQEAHKSLTRARLTFYAHAHMHKAIRQFHTGEQNLALASQKLDYNSPCTSASNSFTSSLTLPALGPPEEIRSVLSTRDETKAAANVNDGGGRDLQGGGS